MEKYTCLILHLLVFCVVKSSCNPYQNIGDDTHEAVTTTRSDIDLVEIELENENFGDQRLNDIDSNTVQPLVTDRNIENAIVPELTEEKIALVSVQHDQIQAKEEDGSENPPSSSENPPSSSENPPSSSDNPPNAVTLPYHVGKADCTCGKKITKIVGGDVSKINDLPWTVLLYKRGFFFGKSAYCGGTVINNLFVLTASHCVDSMVAKGIEVVLNEENTASSSDSEIHVFKVEKIIMHPDYSRRNIDNDIALLKLSRPIELSGAGPIVPACLAINTEDKFEGQDAIAAGWGATAEGSSTSTVLRKVTVPVISNDACNMTRYKGRITPNMLCAGDIEKGGKDSCQGDSGGPLVTTIEDRKMLIGIVSWGYGCARPNSPGVYTRVANYPEWILYHTEGAEWCSN